MANPFVHVELATNDVAKAKSFYGQLFSWKLDDMPMPDGSSYTTVNVGEGTGGGLFKNPMPGAPSAWMPYALVDDLQKAVDKTKALGGTVMKDRTEVMNMGAFAIIVDPTGAMLGLWEPKKS